MVIEIDNRTIECNVQYGKREKIVISMDSIGFITVKAPNNAREEAIINAVRQNGKWIQAKLDEISSIKERTKPREYDGQGKFAHLGKEFFVHELIDIKENGEIGEEELKTKLKKFYFDSCKKVIGERIKIYQKQLGVKPKIIKVEESKSRWGSCNSDKKITFNYRLVMTPIEIIDYVIVHELCHLMHMNHDRSFWRCVGSIFPDYKKREAFLASQGQYMCL